MTTYSKPSVRSAWGQTASGSDLVDPGNTFASAGWQIGVKPPRQYVNWVLNYVFAGIRYSCQRGIPDWDATETYSAGATVLSPGGLLYRCNTANTNQNPDAGPLGSFWDVPYVSSPVGSDNTNRIASTTFVHSNFLPIGSGFNSLSGQIFNAQVPSSAVTQWQGSLSISGSQITSAVQRANTVYNTTGNYSTFNWVGQTGQPSWLWGSNDGVNYFVWNPSNFSVANATTCAGLSPTVFASGSSIVARDGNGYIYTPYFSQSSPNNENPSISQIMVTNGTDNFVRKASTAAVKAALGALAVADFPALLAANGYQKLPTGVILQWGSAFINGTTTVNFPVTFPNGVSHVALTNINSTNQIFLTTLAASSFTASNGSSTVSWLAMGY